MWAALLGFGALVALLISWQIKPARFWIALIMAGYFIPRYWDLAGFGQIYMFNLLMDATICLVINRYAAKPYELKLYTLFRVSAATSLVAVTGHVILQMAGAPQIFKDYYFEGYGIALEAINWTALAIITREGWPEFYGHLAANISGRPYRETARQTVHSARTPNSWQHK